MYSYVSTSSRPRGGQTTIFHLLGGCLFVGLLFLGVGCSTKRREVKHADVTGKVLFRGKPLPGGQVVFVTVKGGFNSSAVIDEKGNYQISAPVGEVTIAVDNGMLEPQRGPSVQGFHPKSPDAEETEKPIKGRWVNIPHSYADPSTSDLKYTVKPGPQTYNIELSDKPIPPPNAAGP